MKPIRVNGDYESELFYGKVSSVLSESLEFLAMFLQDRPIYSQKNYSQEYLNYVAEVSGIVPELKKQGPYENWWGNLSDPELERKLNSKLTSTQLVIDQGWCDKTFIVNERDEFPTLPLDEIFLLKNPYGMSGRGFKLYNESTNLDSLELPIILEPLFKRKYDFSHYVYPDGKIVPYENKVDGKFQYRGTIIRNPRNPNLKDFPFYHVFDSAVWNEFQNALSVVKAHYSLGGGFSIDSFVYELNERTLIRALSEVNYRRTMGSVAYELAIKFGHPLGWNALILGKLNKKMSFKEIKNCITSSAIKLLSPDEVRYQIFFLSANDDEEGRNLFNELKASLPDCQFAIEI